MSDSKSQWIVDTTDDNFDADVIQRSASIPVVVDFWADWCAPCRMLGPVLESLATELNGKFLLVKADTEKNQSAAAQYGVSGIPAVFAVVEGEIVDGFQGALPEESVRQWLTALFTKSELQQAKSLMDSDPDLAETTLRSILLESPDAPEVSIALAELLLDSDRDDECRQIIDGLADRGFLEPAAETLKAKLELKSKATLDIDAITARAETSPDDLTIQLELAQALVGNTRYEEAFKICLQLVEKDRKGFGEQARELMVEVFRALPDDSELTREYRRKLSMLLY